MTLRSHHDVVPLTDPAVVLAGLAADAAADGRGMVLRLIAEWSDGSNRFDRHGECAYVALDKGRVVAVCGLNIDPYAGDRSVGRVRRLYIATFHRRHRAATAIMEVLVDDARGHFRSLHVRTDDTGASAFYESIGFTRVVGDPNCTHRRPVAPPSATVTPG
jgi:GNAT superfamily N-acetyltransferase